MKNKIFDQAIRFFEFLEYRWFLLQIRLVPFAWLIPYIPFIWHILRLLELLMIWLFLSC